MAGCAEAKPDDAYALVSGTLEQHAGKDGEGDENDRGQDGSADGHEDAIGEMEPAEDGDEVFSPEKCRHVGGGNGEDIERLADDAESPTSPGHRGHYDERAGRGRNGERCGE